MKTTNIYKTKPNKTKAWFRLLYMVSSQEWIKPIYSSCGLQGAEISATRHSKRQRVLNCRVLPLGKFNGTILFCDESYSRPELQGVISAQW